MERYRPEMDWNPTEGKPKDVTINRIVTENPRLRSRAEALLARVTADYHPREGAETVELPERLREIIQELLVLEEDFVRQYGAEPASIDETMTHLVSNDSGNKAATFNRDSHQNIEIFERGNQELKDFLIASIVAHEALHAHSFHSVDAKPGHYATVKIIGRRSGLSVMVDGVSEGDWINEAMTEELNIRFRKTYTEMIPEFRRQQSKMLEGPNRSKAESREVIGMVAKPTPEDSTNVETYKHAYRLDRMVLNALLDDMSAKLPERFPTREDAFNMFARAYFTGNLLPLGRELEGLYGKNALRRLMEGEGLA